MKRVIECTKFVVPALLAVLPLQMASASTVLFGAASHTTVKVPETFGQLTLKFRLVNNGPLSIAITKVEESTSPVSGDTLLDGLVAGTTNGCNSGSVILAGKWCTVDAKFTVIDADPGDSFLATDDTGNWNASVAVTYHDVGVTPVVDQHVSDLRAVAVSDTPEPAIWAMMITGFGLTGGAARRRKTQTA